MVRPPLREDDSSAEWQGLLKSVHRAPPLTQAPEEDLRHLLVNMMRLLVLRLLDGRDEPVWGESMLDQLRGRE